MKTASFNLAIACSALLAGAMPGHGQALNISTLAGQALPGSTDGAGYAARFSFPNGVAADATGNVFVADTGNHTIRKITPAGIVSTVAGSPGNAGSADGVGTNALFRAPRGIALDVLGNLYVADTGNSTIRKITPAGGVTTLAGLAGDMNSFDGTVSVARFNQPQALVVNVAGNLCVADTANQTVRVITLGGMVSTLAGLAGYAGGVDGTNSKARFNQPSGIARDAVNNLFVTDFLNHTIRRITPGGTVSTIAGLAGVWGRDDGTNRAARFFQPQGIVADGAGGFFIVDSGNQTIRRIATNGANWVVTTVAGWPGRAGNRDESGSAAELYFPSGTAVDGTGRFYVADLGNNSLRTDQYVPPVLRLWLAAQQCVLAWPASASAFQLDKASHISASATWTLQTNGIAMSGDGFVLTNAIGGAAAFYRLHRP